MFNPEADEAKEAINDLDFTLGRPQEAPPKQEPQAVADWIAKYVQDSWRTLHKDYRQDYDDFLRAHAERRMEVKLPIGRKPPVR